MLRCETKEGQASILRNAHGIAVGWVDDCGKLTVEDLSLLSARDVEKLHEYIATQRQLSEAEPEPEMVRRYQLPESFGKSVLVNGHHIIEVCRYGDGGKFGHYIDVHAEDVKLSPASIAEVTEFFQHMNELVPAPGQENKLRTFTIETTMDIVADPECGRTLCDAMMKYAFMRAHDHAPAMTIRHSPLKEITP